MNRGANEDYNGHTVELQIRLNGKAHCGRGEKFMPIVKSRSVIDVTEEFVELMSV